jgi:hypothetical protein
MARKTIAALVAQANTDLANNTTGLITPVLLRTLLTDILDTVNPAYAGMEVTGSVDLAANTTAKPIIWNTNSVTQSPFSTVMGTGSVVNGIQSTVRHTLSFNTTCANGTNLTIGIYRNNVATEWSCLIAGNNQVINWDVSLSGVTSAVGINDSYQVRIQSSQTGDVTITKGQWLVEQIPMRG